MKDIVLSREEVLSLPHEVDLLNARSWSVQWAGTDLEELHALVEDCMPPTVPFLTSGSTGEPRPWQLRPEQMLAEVLALSDELAGPPFDGVVSFAPPRHRYGAHCSLLLPAVLGCRAWVRPRSVGSLPSLAGGRWLVVAIPSTFTILRQRHEWLAAARSVTILHSSAQLPAAAHELLDELPDIDLTLVELLGSTETGAVATRTHPPGGDLWTLVTGVTFAPQGPRTAGDDRLTVRSPWLAHPPRGGDTAEQELDDVVERCGERQFRLLARAGRIVKVNGERHHLDDVAAQFGEQLGGREVACIGVVDPVVGEHFELYVVDPASRRDGLDGEIRRAISAVGLHPRRVRLVTELVTSSTGKIVFGQANTREDTSRDTTNRSVDGRPEPH